MRRRCSAWALERLGEKAKLAIVLQNIGQYVVQDDENQTAYLKLPNEGYWWWWYGSEIETDAFYLKLLARTDPKGELAPRLVKYVLNNRKHGSYWNSTRDTAFCIEALADYLKASGEDRPDMSVTIALDGQSRKEVKITPADLFRSTTLSSSKARTLATGRAHGRVPQAGQGPALLQRLSDQLHARRPDRPRGPGDQGRSQGLPADQAMTRRWTWPAATASRSARRSSTIAASCWPRERPSRAASWSRSSSRSTARTITSTWSSRTYKAAGFEPVEVRSGYNGNDLGAYVEFRDDRVAFFARTLARGKHSVSYRLRAEIPGKFHALPARAQAMYAPELKANSDEIQLKIVD